MLRSINFFENFTKIIRFLDISFKFLKRKCAILSIQAFLLATSDFWPLNIVCEDSVKDSTTAWTTCLKNVSREDSGPKGH